MLFRFLNRSLGIFHLEAFGIVRLETSSQLRQPAGSSIWLLSLESFDEDLSLVIFGDLSLEIFRDHSLGDLGRLAPANWDFRLECFAGELPFKIVRFESFNCKLPIAIFRLGTFA